MNYYLQDSKKSYLRAMRRKHFLSKYHRQLTKDRYERLKKQSENKFHYYHVKLIGILAIVMSCTSVVVAIHALIFSK
jgi:hypothetical protein